MPQPLWEHGKGGKGSLGGSLGNKGQSFCKRWCFGCILRLHKNWSGNCFCGSVGVRGWITLNFDRSAAGNVLRRGTIFATDRNGALFVCLSRIDCASWQCMFFGIYCRSVKGLWRIWRISFYLVPFSTNDCEIN